MSTSHAASLRHQRRSASEDTLRLRLRVYLARARLDRQIVAGHPILGLAERLEGPGPVSPVGVASAQTLLTDGLSPLFNRNSEQTVTQAIWKIQDALDAAPRELCL